MTIPRRSIRNKLILSTLLPVTAVFALLFWLGVSHVRAYVSDDARHMLSEHARHQASRLALVLSQVPALAESLGDIVIAEPDQPQALRYAHLIDGLRRTPIAKAAGIAQYSPAGGAYMRRGAPAGRAIPADEIESRPPGWHTNGSTLKFIRAIHYQGQRVGESWVELDTADLYREIERLRSPAVRLFVSDTDGHLLEPDQGAPPLPRIATGAGVPLADGAVATVRGTDDGVAYWVVNSELPDMPWRVTALTPTEIALQRARTEATLFALGLLLALLAIVVIVGVATGQITRPLATLDASVRQIAQGDFAVAPDVASNDELGGLAQAIRRMGVHIRDREQQLRNAQQVLEQRVAARTADLQQSNTRLMRQIKATRKTQEALRLASEQAQQASRAKSEFLSNMSHELRTPLHGVLGYAQILRRDTPANSSQRESLEAIERCGQHLLTLINDILDLTKIEAGQMRVDIQPTDLLQLLEDVRTIVAQRARTKGLALHLEIATDLPTAILTDPVKLKQILLNLLGNAVKFTTRGAVTLAVQAVGEDLLQFEVADTGVGIPSDKIDAIFDAFHQARAGQAIDGTGLGLAINQRLIALLGGQPMQVLSAPGAGSRFSFRIPLQPTEQLPGGLDARRHDNRPARLQLTAGQSCAVLVVDPVTENRNMLATLLRYAGCRVESLDTREQAVQRLSDEAFDLIVMDVRLPGDAAITDLRRQAAFGEPKVLAISAQVFPGAASMAHQLGFDAFLGIPFSDRQLLDVIGSLLGLRFEPRGEQRDVPVTARPHWPVVLAQETALRIREAIDMGDVANLFQLADELADNPDAPRADVDNMALMARLFDFDGLRQLCNRLQATDAPA
ncbi:MAG: response regulator [Chromatiaceae bacterium]|nr:response regulator [Chromatiaceae bacterium]